MSDVDLNVSLSDIKLMNCAAHDETKLYLKLLYTNKYEVSDKINKDRFLCY